MKICPRCSQAFGDGQDHCPKDGSALETGTDPMAGRTVGGRYRLVARVGSGGMSAVYLAKHLVSGRRMAIKALRRDLAKDPVQRDRFLREARAVNRIDHENIVGIVDFGETEDGLVYLVMEYVDGISLFQALTDAPFGAGRALRVADDVAAALGRAHQMAVVHRDLKPENVLLTESDGRERAMILDFGIAKIFDAPSLTGSQQIFGTPGYIAPEYIQSTQIDGRADLYSLGVILYEMITGALPFEYQYPGDLLVKHVTEEPIPPRDRHAAVPPPLEDLLLRCLRKVPDDRFRDAHHFRAELARVRSELGLGASEAGAPSRSTATEVPGGSGHPTLRVGRFGAEPNGVGAAEQAASDSEAQDAVSPSVERWRHRLEVVRERLRRSGQASAPEVVRSLAFVSRTLEELEELAARCETHQRRIESLDEEAHDTRLTLGRAMDDLAGRLSSARGDLDRAVRYRDDLHRRREAILERRRAGEVSEAEADAALWELATAEQEVRKYGRVCDEHETGLTRLRAQLEVENERIESERSRSARALGREMDRIESMTTSLRSRVEELEERSTKGAEGDRDTPSGPASSG